MRPFFLRNPFKLKPGLTTTLFLLLTACGGTPLHQTYEGPPRPDNEIATFIVPGAFNLLAIDGAKNTRASIKDGAIIKVLPGVHEFLVEYQEFWNTDGENIDKVTSKPIAIRVTMQAAKQYTIGAKKLEDIEDSEAFAKDPKITVIDQSTRQAVTAEVKTNRYVGGFLSSLFGPSAAPTLAASASDSEPSPAAPAGSKALKNKDGKALEMLKYWWETADKTQQDSFQTWLETQSRP